MIYSLEVLKKIDISTILIIFLDIFATPSSGATVSRSKAVWPSGGGGYSGNTASGSSYLSSSKESFNKANIMCS